MTSAFNTDLDFELFEFHNSAIAQSVALAVLVGGDRGAQTVILSEVQAEYLWPPYRRFLFETMVQMIQTRGFVDVEQLREHLVEFASSGSPEFVQGCLANLDQMLGLSPTPEHIEKALQIIKYDRTRKKAQRLQDELLNLCCVEDREYLPSFEHWLEDLGWTERDVQEVANYFRDRGEKAVWHWVHMRQIEEDVAQEISQMLRAMGAF